MTIQACAMSFNEIDFIECYLRNVERFVDAVVIMDGGSTDGTIEKIAEIKKAYSIPLDLHVIPQKGLYYTDPAYNHSERRNLLLSLTDPKYDYLFNLDIDENLISMDRDCLRHLARTDKTAYIFKRYTFWVHPGYFRSDWCNYIPWLFKNISLIKYGTQNPPHEVLTFDNECLVARQWRIEGKQGATVDIPIHHYHYCFGRKAFAHVDHHPISREEFYRRRKIVLTEDDRLIKWEGLISPEFEKYCEKVEF